MYHTFIDSSLPLKHVLVIVISALSSFYDSILHSLSSFPPWWRYTDTDTETLTFDHVNMLHVVWWFMLDIASSSCYVMLCYVVDILSI